MAMSISARIEQVAIALVFLFVFSGSDCEEEDPTCWDACRHLLRCEAEWLAAENHQMSEHEEDEFRDDCVEECEAAGEPLGDIECIMEASCDELADGVCR
jgi:hypothetical protein